MTNLLPAVRRTLRRWKQRPILASVVVLTLSLGIAAATAMFSVLDAVVLRPLPWRDPDALVRIYAMDLKRRDDPRWSNTWHRGSVPRLAWQSLESIQPFERVAAWSDPRRAFVDSDVASIVSVMNVSSDFFSVLGVTPAEGTFFERSDDSGASDHAIISYEFWQRSLGGRPQVIGQTVVLRDSFSDTRTIVGVAPRGFRFGNHRPDVFVPISKGFVNVSVLARLADRASMQVAFTAADAIIRHSSNTRGELSARVVPLAEDQLGEKARPLWWLSAGAGLLLLIACVNVVGLLTGELSARQHEIGVRVALGATRRQLISEVYTEQILLSGVAAISGLLLATWLTHVIVALAPPGLPNLDAVSVNLRCGGLAVAIAWLTVLTLGVVPLLSSSRARIGTQTAGLGGAFSRRAYRTQQCVVVMEVALGLSLLVCATLFSRTMTLLTSEPVGFQPRGLIVVSTSTPSTPSEVSGRRDVVTVATADVLESLSRLPQVIDVAATTSAPFLGPAISTGIDVPGRGGAGPIEERVVTEGAIRTLGMTLVAGRSFATSDRSNLSVALVSRTFADRFFDGEAVGRTFSARGYRLEIIGVVSDIKQNAYSDMGVPIFYTIAGPTDGKIDFLVRGSGDPTKLLRDVKATIERAAPKRAVTRLAAMDTVLADSAIAQHFRARLAQWFAATALALAAIGFGALVLRRVMERRREIGLRIALGARPAHVYMYFLRDVIKLVAIGVAVGLPPAILLGRLADAWLYGISVSAPIVLIGPTLVLVIAGVAAAIVPARRATAIDPVESLRN